MIARSMRLLSAVTAVAVLTACGDGADTADPAADTADTADPAVDATTTAPATVADSTPDATPESTPETPPEASERSVDCGPTDVTFTNIGAGTSFSPTETGAIGYAEGSAYTVYLGDFAIDSNELSMFSVPEPTADQKMVTVAITTFNPTGTPELPAVGTPIVHEMDEFGVLTFVVMGNEGATMLSNNLDGEGSLTISALGDTMCFDIEYSDAEKSISGTVSAPVKTV